MTATLPPPRGSKPSVRRSPPKAIEYPTGDGKPMAEDVLHRKLMFYACESLETYLANRPDAHVSGNDFVYYEEGNVRARVSPDTYVVIGVPRRLRRSYKVWEENGVAPAVVFEFTSKKTRREDVTIKRPLYEQVLRVQEYFQFDPTGDYLKPRLQGQRLQAGRYEAIALHNDRMWSEQLGLELVIVGENLRFYDPARGEWLRTYEEAEAERKMETLRAEAEAQRAESEKQRAETAEAELARLRAELEALRQQK